MAVCEYGTMSTEHLSDREIQRSLSLGEGTTQVVNHGALLLSSALIEKLSVEVLLFWSFLFGES